MTRYVNLQCNAKTRRGTPCKCRRLPGKRRCRLHGGLSTGPKTDQGKAKAAKNLEAARAAIAHKPPEWFSARAQKAGVTRLRRIQIEKQRQQREAKWKRWEQEDGAWAYQD